MIGGMERIDQQILTLLAKDGRMSFTDIGRATGLSTSAAQQRVRRLEQRGIIAGYHAEFSAVALGRTLTAFISIGTQGNRQDDDIPMLLAELPEITACYSVAGDASFLCMAEVGGTSELDQLLSRIRGLGNLSTTTTVALTTFFRDRPLVSEA